MSKDRTAPCIYYVCAHKDCKKGFKDVTIKRCKNCAKYKPRKTNNHTEPIKHKRQKDFDRHNNWRNDI